MKDETIGAKILACRVSIASMILPIVLIIIVKKASPEISNLVLGLVSFVLYLVVWLMIEKRDKLYKPFLADVPMFCVGTWAISILVIQDAQTVKYIGFIALSIQILLISVSSYFAEFKKE